MLVKIMQDAFFSRDSYINISPLFKENTWKAFTYLFQALVYLAPLIIFLYYYFYKGTYGRDKLNTVEDVERLEKRRYKYRIINGVFMAGLYILFAIRVHWYYQPSNSEISMAVLINYLKNNLILDNKIYEVLKQYKPDRVGNFVKN